MFINGIEQLDYSNIYSLYLVVYLLSQVTEGETIIDLARSILCLLKDDVEPTAKLTEKYVRLGLWQVEEAKFENNQKALMFEALDEGVVYHVNDDFPCLVPNRLKASLANEVKSISYQIDVKNVGVSSWNDLEDSFAITYKNADGPDV